MNPYRPIPESKPRPTYSDYLKDYLLAFGGSLSCESFSLLKKAEKYAASHTNPKNRIIII